MDYYKKYIKYKTKYVSLQKGGSNIKCNIENDVVICDGIIGTCNKGDVKEIDETLTYYSGHLEKEMKEIKEMKDTKKISDLSVYYCGRTKMESFRDSDHKFVGSHIKDLDINVGTYNVLAEHWNSLKNLDAKTKPELGTLRTEKINLIK